jgi:hypothetical protein
LFNPSVTETGAYQVGKGKDAVVWRVDWSILVCPLVECLLVEFEVVKLVFEVFVGVLEGGELVEEGEELAPV